MYKTRIKICGITSVADGLMVASRGADALGLVFYKPSPRCVTVDLAADIARAVGPFVSLVGLFVNASADHIRSVLAQVPLHLLQFHGDETPAFCEQFQRPYIKAIRMREQVDVLATCRAYASASGILLDSYRQGVPGGTGESFDWARVPREMPVPLILAGGLNAANITQAITQCRPYAVDTSGGVESSPGHKHDESVHQFITAVVSADHQQQPKESVL
ncbi:MAG: phosphoribosylanthranilate isomerase [Cellvibrionaceae bacterium]|nr:phosphoribosylanthranilate isomerase [Cellvibrionaceae bacterium]